jgi:hypothetical protein
MCFSYRFPFAKTEFESRGENSPASRSTVNLLLISVAAGRTVAASGPVAATAIRLRRGNPEGQHHQSHKAQHSFRDRFHDNSPNRSSYFKPLVLTTPTHYRPRQKTRQMGLEFRSGELGYEETVPQNWEVCLRYRTKRADPKPEVRGRPC